MVQHIKHWLLIDYLVNIATLQHLKYGLSSSLKRASMCRSKAACHQIKVIVALLTSSCYALVKDDLRCSGQ